MPPLTGARLLELGAGTGKQTAGLLSRGAQLVSTDLGPRMLGRLHAAYPSIPVVVARAEALPFATGSFDAVCGAQMWHWVDAPVAAAEVARVLRPGGWLALWWNEVDAQDQRWWLDLQDRLEASSPGYRRDYRQRDYAEELVSTGLFGSVTAWSGTWVRELDGPLYERWLRSRSYVEALPDREAFLAAERASMRAAFGGGPIREPFQVRLWVARTFG